MRRGERLREIIEGALPQRLDARLYARIAGHHDHDRVVIGPERGAQQRQPVHLRHVEVHEHDVKRPSLEQVEGILAATGHRHVVPLVPEHRGATLPQGVFVVDHENPHAGLRLRPDRQQGRRFASFRRLAAVMSHRHRHQATSSLTVGRLLRRVRAILVATLQRRAFPHEMGNKWGTRGPAPIPLSHQGASARRAPLHSIAAWGRPARRGARYRTCRTALGRHAPGRRSAARYQREVCHP